MEELGTKSAATIKCPECKADIQFQSFFNHVMIKHSDKIKEHNPKLFSYDFSSRSVKLCSGESFYMCFNHKKIWKRKPLAEKHYHDHRACVEKNKEILSKYKTEESSEINVPTENVIVEKVIDMAPIEYLMKRINDLVRKNIILNNKNIIYENLLDEEAEDIAIDKIIETENETQEDIDKGQLREKDIFEKKFPEFLSKE